MGRRSAVLVIVRMAAVGVCALTLLSGRPPADGQQRSAPVQTEAVVTARDERQDIEMSKLQEFQKNQEAWNHQTGDQLARNTSDVTKLYGGITAIMALAAAGVVFQWRKP